MRVGIIGGGLIGGSVALGLREAGWSVFVHDPAAEVQAQLQASRLAVIQDAEQLHDPDLLVVATPPAQVAGWALQLLEAYPRAVVTDVCSLKGQVDRQVRGEASAEQLSRWVPGHPMAGRAGSGFAAADAKLFAGQRWLLCPSPENASAVAVVQLLAAALGARARLIEAAQHDRLVAWSSALVQLTASALQQAVDQGLGDELAQVAGTGLRDTTRVAELDPQLWQQLVLGNQQSVLQALSGLEGQLAELRELIEAGRAGELERWLAQGTHARRQLARSCGWVRGPATADVPPPPPAPARAAPDPKR